VNTEQNAVSESRLESQVVAPAAASATRPFYWSVRRELWEHRYIYLAPLAIAGVFLLGFLISLATLPHRMRALLPLDPDAQQAAIAKPFDFAALLMMGTAFIISLFYCIGALHGERRDRSILFWKSMPVSDRTTVFAKAAIPILILQPLAFVFTLAMHWVMLLLSSVALLGNGAALALLWTRVPWISMWLMLLFHLIAIHALWYAPIYAWLLMVSAWARRVPFLWAVLPLIVLSILEKLIFGTPHSEGLLLHRFAGGQEGANFEVGTMSMDPLAHVHPLQFLVSPGLWFGLVLAAIFLALAVRLRRYREPI
jgi:ABC-2 type transport system permease protein